MDFCNCLVINISTTLSVCFDSLFKENITGKKKKNKVDFTLEKCSGAFYSFLTNILPHFYVHYILLQNLCKNQIESRLHPSQQF